MKILNLTELNGNATFDERDNQVFFSFLALLSKIVKCKLNKRFSITI